MGKTFAELEKEYAKERALAKTIREAQERKRTKKALVRDIRAMKIQRKYGTAIRITEKVGKKVARASVALADATIPQKKQPRKSPKKRVIVRRKKLPKQPSMFEPTQDWGF